MGLLQLPAFRLLLLELPLQLLQLTLLFFHLSKMFSILIYQQLLLGTKMVLQLLDLSRVFNYCRLRVLESVLRFNFVVFKLLLQFVELIIKPLALFIEAI